MNKSNIDVKGMKEIIKLNSKYEENNYLKKLSKPDGSETLTYKLKTSNQYIREGKVKDKKFVDPSGGPMIVEGEFLQEAEMVVKSIDFVIGFGYIISFEMPDKEVQELVDKLVEI